MEILPLKTKRCCNNQCPLIKVCKRYIQKNVPAFTELKYGIFEYDKSRKICKNLIK